MQQTIRKMYLQEEIKVFGVKKFKKQQE